MCAFMEIESAFDNTTHQSVAEALTKINVDITTYRWMSEIIVTLPTETQVGANTIRMNSNQGV